MYVNVQFILNIESMQSIRLTLSDVEEFSTPPDFTEIRVKIDKQNKFYNIYLYVLFNIYAIIEIVAENPCEIYKQAENLTYSCGCFVPTIFPFNINVFPVYQLLFLFEYISSFHILIGGAYIMLLAYEIVLYIGSRMNHLCLILESIPNEGDENVQKQTMKHCIRYHQQINRTINELTGLYKKVFAIHAIFTAVVFALQAKLASENVSSRIHIACWLIAIFLMCHSGQELTHIGETLGEKIMYMCKWYKLNTSLQKDLMLMLLHTQKPVIFPAGYFATLNYNLFITIVKTAYSYWTLIVNTQKDN
ncbi:odorant receptor 4-like [Aethina tumida]|uniref:odorant receptor 4-like n=1 Tax=Aethina tumida TaxID=116153 RepID=UPI0021484109|nr:odorant receptor 4-like [Aethina tumida]